MRSRTPQETPKDGPQTKDEAPGVNTTPGQEDVSDLICGTCGGYLDENHAHRD